MKAYKINFQDIQKDFNIIEVATKKLNLNLHKVNDDEWRGLSVYNPNVNDTCTGFNSSTGEFFDFKENKGGGILKLVAIVKLGNENRIYDAAKFLVGENANFDSEYWQKVQNCRDNFLRDIEKWEKRLTEPKYACVLDYLHKRKIPDEYIKKLRMGVRDDNALYEERLAFTYFNENGEPVYYATRRLEMFKNYPDSPKYKKGFQDEFLKNVPFGLHTIPAKDKNCTTLVIGEGMFDAFSAELSGFSILFSIGGDFGKDNEHKVISIAKKFDRVIFTFDSDGAGIGFTKRLGKKFFDAGVNFSCVNSYPIEENIIKNALEQNLISEKDVVENGAGVKDLSAFYILGGNIPELLKGAKSGLSFLAETLITETPFKALSANEREKVAKDFQDLSDKARKLLNTGVLDDSDITAAKEILSGYLPKKILDNFCGDEKAKILTPAELERILGELEISLRLNGVSKKCDISGLPEDSPLIQDSFKEGSESKKKRDSVELLPVFLTAYMKLQKYKFSQDYLKDCLGCIASSNEFNPVMEIVKNTQWDGVDRIFDLREILGIQSFNFESTMLKKWLVQAISIVQNDDFKTNLDFALVLQGKQGKGKTLFFRKLAIRHEFFVEGAVIDMRVKDTVIISTGAWICELGELDSTLKKEQSDLKSFITSPKDQYRKPYAREDQDYPRRTCFCATVNPEKFLRDETGSRRFVVINADKLDLPRLKSLDENFYIQLWAQVYDIYLKGEVDYRLTPDEIAENEKRNLGASIELPGEREILESLDWTSTAWKFQSATEIKNLLQLKMDARQIGKALAKIADNDRKIEQKRGQKERHLYFLPTTIIINKNSNY